MISLDQADARKLSLITTQNGADCVVVFSNYTTATGAYARDVPTLTTVASATTTDICATPSAGAIRDIDYVNIKNTYAGSHTVTVEIRATTGGPFVLVKCALLTDESLSYTHGSGWAALDANGNRKEVTSSVFSSLTVTGNETVGGTLGVTGISTVARVDSTILTESTGLAWTDYTPTISAETGTWGALTVTTAKYRLLGKTLFLRVQLSATVASGAPTQARISLPGGASTAAGQSGIATQGYTNNGNYAHTEMNQNASVAYIVFGLPGGAAWVGICGWRFNGVVELA